MAFPQGETLALVTRYQGVMIADIAIMFIFYMILKMVHFCMWGHLYTDPDNESEEKKEADVDERKWSQDTWDVYFPIIFANHVIALAFPLLYLPTVFADVLAFLHLACFFGLLIVNVFIKDTEAGKGPRTTVTRILWFLMCLFNVVLIIAGLAGVPSVMASYTVA